MMTQLFSCIDLALAKNSPGALGPQRDFHHVFKKFHLAAPDSSPGCSLWLFVQYCLRKTSRGTWSTKDSGRGYYPRIRQSCNQSCVFSRHQSRFRKTHDRGVGRPTPYPVWRPVKPWQNAKKISVERYQLTFAQLKYFLLLIRTLSNFWCLKVTNWCIFYRLMSAVLVINFRPFC